MYLTAEQIHERLNLPQFTKSAEELLNLYQNHQFSFTEDLAVEVYKKVAKAIPIGV